MPISRVKFHPRWGSQIRSDLHGVVAIPAPSVVVFMSPELPSCPSARICECCVDGSTIHPNSHKVEILDQSCHSYSSPQRLGAGGVSIELERGERRGKKFYILPGFQTEKLMFKKHPFAGKFLALTLLLCEGALKLLGNMSVTHLHLQAACELARQTNSCRISGSLATICLCLAFARFHTK